MISLKVGLGVAAGALLFLAGYLARGEQTKILDRPITKIETLTQQQVQTQIIDHVVNHTVTKVVTVHDKATGADTTTTTTTADTTKEKAVDKVSDTKSDTVAEKQALSNPTQYSLELDWTPRVDPRAYYPTAATIGYRIAGPVWVTGGFSWYEHDALLGVRIEL